MLVHSPALGPSTWRWVADALTGRGHEVVVPDLRDAVATGDPGAFVDTVATAVGPAVDDIDAVVGHSGAGPLLAAVATTARRVFVDAGLPADGPDPFVGRLRSLAVDGVLPPWSTWFGPDLLAGSVPDPVRRAAIEADEPRAPLAFYEAPRPPARVPVHGAYLLLSDAYRADADRADALGLLGAEVPSSHLGIVTHPDEVVTAIEGLLAP